MSATTSDSNQPYNPSLVNGYTTALPTLRMELESTSRHRDSGRTTGNVHSLILGFLVPSHTPIALPTCYRKHEQEKKRAYDQCIREVEHGCFSPLVFSAAGGMGPTANVVYKKLASMIAIKHNQSYSQTVAAGSASPCFDLQSCA